MQQTTVTLTGPGSIGDINVIVSVEATPQPGGVYQYQYKLMGVTNADYQKLCQIARDNLVDALINTQVAGAPAGLTNGQMIGDEIGGLVVQDTSAIPPGARTTAPTDPSAFYPIGAQSVRDAVNNCGEAQLDGVIDGNFQLVSYGYGQTYFDAKSAQGPVDLSAYKGNIYLTSAKAGIVPAVELIMTATSLRMTDTPSPTSPPSSSATATTKFSSTPPTTPTSSPCRPATATTSSPATSST
jgi:hypothetical protein